ncbi:permease-like cell division protein FtsX [Coxiella-like endosymbiont]|uniref:permease-like cell division protein FtsX n=1 Tax=Coxiella-like endosymbiont TaxID=1592897 RepID=UPI00272D4C72|nr:permease-like cell division protein FtsX [Coxiella-like endosymbiont]
MDRELFRLSKTKTPKFQIKTFIAQLKNRNDISHIQYISPSFGLNELKKLMALENIIDTLQSNPLPPVIVVSLKNNNLHNF